MRLVIDIVNGSSDLNGTHAVVKGSCAVPAQFVVLVEDCRRSIKDGKEECLETKPTTGWILLLATASRYSIVSLESLNMEQEVMEE
jgi:hypothetical protein